MERETVLIVEDDSSNSYLMKTILEPLNTNFILTESAEAAIEILGKNEIKLIIADYYLKNSDASSIIEYIKQTKAKSPIIIVSGEDVPKIELLGKGAVAFIKKPINSKEFFYIAKNLLELVRAYNGLEESDSIIHVLVSALDHRDSYTEGHSIRVLEFSDMLFDELGFNDEEDRKNLKIGCMLHDIGKIGVPDSILKSIDPLSTEERKVIETHPMVGYEICNSVTNLQGCIDIIRWHHEKVDGSGYPDGLKSKQIPDLVQIVTIADIFDALTTKRTYREENTVMDAMDIILKETEEGKLNKYFVMVFNEIVKRRIRRRGVKNDVG